MAAKMIVSVMAVCTLLLAMTMGHILPQRAPRSFCGTTTEVACILFPEVIEGPYYWEDLWVRQDITEGYPGVKLRLVLTVQNTKTCEVAVNAAVDLWHCDAVGIYSHYIGPSTGNPNAPTDNTTFFRGIQITDKDGQVTFDTIFPGWYQGRTVHTHIKVHIGGEVQWRSEDNTYRYEGGETSFTGQMFFNETITATVAKTEPYTDHSNVPRLTNEQDNIYLNGGYYGLTSIEYVQPELGLDGGLIGHLTIGVEY